MASGAGAGVTRLAPQPGRADRPREAASRSRSTARRVQGFEGDTIGSALYASGQRVFSRSFKYHRPRGLACCSGHCANCQMTVDGIPSVRVCTAPLREGAVVKGQNYVGSLTRDLMQVTDKLGGPFTPPGFYYKTFIRPRKLWPLYEKILRGAAGLGPLDPNGSRQERIDVEHRHVDVVVIGGGQAGLEAATAAAAGRRVGRRDRRGLRRRRRAARRPRRDRHRGGASRERARGAASSCSRRRSRSASSSRASCRSPTATCCSSSARTVSSSRAGSSSSRSSSRATTSSA